MNYEEKYKQALERARIEYKNEQSKGNIWVCENLSTIFPELKESEDERIRKEIIELVHFFYGSSSVYEHHVSEDDMISWLEKQDEQGIIDLKEYAKGILKGAAIHLMIWIDENLADGKMCLSNMECEDLEDAMVNAKWDKIYKYIKKKVEKQDEQKSAWSEEDEKMLDSIIDCLDGLIFIDSDQINWLKSLKPNHWKPSEEQMSMLLAVLNDPNNITSESVYIALKLLYNDLKKL